MSDRAGSWIFDEMNQVGVDYANPAEVAAYDARHRRFRDVDAENGAIIEAIGLSESQVVIDMGSGTGALALAAAKVCRRVLAIDVSPAMLAYSGALAEAEEVRNIEFHHAGLLTYAHAGEPVDVIVSQFALHHLPDFWKQVALNRLFAMLKPGGKFCLNDVVFSFDIQDYESVFQASVEDAAATVGEKHAWEWARHLSVEYSTMDWIMERMLGNAGFSIDSVDYKKGVLASYVCSR